MMGYIPCDTTFDTIEAAQVAADTLDYIGFKNWLGVFQKPDGAYVFDCGWEYPKTHRYAMQGKWVLVASRWPHKGVAWQATNEPFDVWYQLGMRIWEAQHGE